MFSNKTITFHSKKLKRVCVQIATLGVQIHMWFLNLYCFIWHIFRKLTRNYLDIIIITKRHKLFRISRYNQAQFWLQMSVNIDENHLLVLFTDEPSNWPIFLNFSWQKWKEMSIKVTVETKQEHCLQVPELHCYWAILG